MRPFREHLLARSEHLRRRGLLREPATSSAPSGTHVTLGGQRLLNLASNNYLGLASDPRVLDALSRAARTWGSAAASRLVTGSLLPHREAEAALAAFVDHEDARLFSSGYAANVGAISGLVGRGDVVFSDALNHASLIDGCRLSRAEVVVYPHRDVALLAELLERHRPTDGAALIVSDAVFSMDADLAPLGALRALADRSEAGLLVDEAHALGVLGPEGRGLSRALGVRPDVTTGMLGKAFGLQGGFVASSADVLHLLESTARSYVFSTGVHAALAAVLPSLVAWVRDADDARARLRRHRARLARAVPRAFSLPPSIAPEDAEGLVGATPILPVILGESALAMEVAGQLREEGIFAPAIRPPTVAPGTARLRLVPIASHADEDLALAERALARVLTPHAPRGAASRLEPSP